MRSQVVGALLALVTGLRVASAQAPTLRTEVQAAVRAYINAHNAADAGSIAAMYSVQPGVTSIGDGEIIRGWDRIREHLDLIDQITAAQGRLAVNLGSVDVVPLGAGFALAFASYTLTVGVQGTEARQRGAMTLILQNVAGEWKIIHDHTSSLREETAAAAPEAQAAAPAAAGGTTIAIAGGRASEVPAGSYVHYSFELPAGTCAVTGRVEGISGGNKDFEVLVLDDDNFRNWSAGLQAQAYSQSGRVAVTRINAQVSGPGTYHLVISNTFSVSTAKTVQAWAEARCQ